MFIKQYANLRSWLLESYDLRALGDFAIGAFDEVPNDLLSVAVSVFRKLEPADTESVAIQPTPLDDRSYDRERTRRKRAAVLCQIGINIFSPRPLSTVPEWPLVYWWNEDARNSYGSYPKLGDCAPVRNGCRHRTTPGFFVAYGKSSRIRFMTARGIIYRARDSIGLCISRAAKGGYG